MARAGRVVHAHSQAAGDRDPMAELASRLACEPQLAALEAVAAWAEDQGVTVQAVNGMREVIARYAAAPDAPNLDLAMRARRRKIVGEFREEMRAL